MLSSETGRVQPRPETFPDVRTAAILQSIGRNGAEVDYRVWRDRSARLRDSPLRVSGAARHKGRSPLASAVVEIYRLTPMATPDEGPHLGPIADALITRSNGAFEPMFVRSLVAEIAAAFDDVRVRDYLEVLIAKEAADRLRRLQHVGSS